MDAQVRGPLVGNNGSPSPFTAVYSGASRTADAHGRFMQAVLEGRVYSTGMGVTSISNVTFAIATLGATCTPIVGLWNPSTSQVLAVIWQAQLNIIMTALQATGCGPFQWAVSVGNAAITTGLVPFNRRTLAQAGSQCKGYAGTALSGLTNNLAVMQGSSLSGGSAVTAAFLATQAGAQTQAPTGSCENFDGSLIVPPGGVIALLAGGTGVGHSAASGLVWEEIPITT